MGMALETQTVAMFVNGCLVTDVLDSSDCDDADVPVKTQCDVVCRY